MLNGAHDLLDSVLYYGNQYTTTSKESKRKYYQGLSIAYILTPCNYKLTDLSKRQLLI